MKDNQMTMDQYIEHEVKIRVLESKNEDIYKTFHRIGADINSLENKLDADIKALDAKLESRFMILIGLIITSIILPVVLHSLKLI